MGAEGHSCGFIQDTAAPHQGKNLETHQCGLSSLHCYVPEKKRKKKKKRREKSTALPLSIAYPILMCHVKLTTFWPLVTDKLSADLLIGYTAFCLVTVKSPIWNSVRPKALMHNQHKRELTSIFFFFCFLWSDHNHHVDYFVTLRKFCQQRNFCLQKSSCVFVWHILGCLLTPMCVDGESILFWRLWWVSDLVTDSIDDFQGPPSSSPCPTSWTVTRTSCTAWLAWIQTVRSTRVSLTLNQ